MHTHTPQVLLYLSRVYYDSDDLQDAKKVLLQAIHRDPSDYKLRFNVALTMQASNSQAQVVNFTNKWINECKTRV